MENNSKLLLKVLFSIIMCSSIYSQDECDPYLVCGQALTCIDGLLYPTTCGPENCDEPISQCDGDENELNCFDLDYYECGLTLDCVWNFNTGCFPNENGDEEDEDQWNCSDIGTQEECEHVGCDWTFSNNMPGGGSCSGDFEDEEDWEDECRYIENQDECIYAGCMWDEEEGCYGNSNGDEDGPPECLLDCEGIESIDPSGNPYEACDWIVSYIGFDAGFASCTQDCDDETMMEISQVVDACYSCLSDEAFDCADVFGDNDEEDWYCSGLTQDECIEAEDCEPNFSANGSFESCDTIIYEDEECDPNLICGEAVTCIDGLLYPTTCGPDNCDEPIGECNQGDEECDPNLICGEAVTCIDGLLYPTTCGPDNCDEPIGECDDGNGDGPPECLLDCPGIESINPDEDPYRACELILELGQTECIEDCDEEEMVIIDYVLNGCEQCIENNFDCSQVFDGDNVCDCDFSEDCDEGCDCDSDCYSENCLSDCTGNQIIDPNIDADGFCVYILNAGEDCLNECADDIGDVEALYSLCSICIEEPNVECSSFFDEDGDDEGLDECFFDCEEIYDINPEQDPNGTCEIFLTLNGAECIEDCNSEALGFLTLISILCDECLSENSCNDLWNGGEEEYGRLQGTVQYLFGDYIDFIPQAEVHISGENNNPAEPPFEEILFTDEYGYYEINLPVGFYYVTAFVFDEELTQEIYIDSGLEYNLDFLLGDPGGGWDGLLGDINSDFEINVLDVVLLVNFVLGIDEPSEYQLMLSDMNQDGAIDILDVVQVINLILDR